ncbi:MAG: 4a-hydroxytetrahydrobiopterin dehydratase [Hyphomicrobiales bacterium]
MAGNEKLSTYNEGEITAKLARDLPHWSYADGHIQRRINTHNWKSTLMVINTIGHLAEAAWHHPDISASFNYVEVRLMSHDAKGITDKDFELARKIDDVVYWQPGREVGALTGVPADNPRFACIKYDD